MSDITNKLTKKSVLKEWVESLLIAFILAMTIRAFVVQAFKIPTGSMRMTLIEGDLILVNKFIYGAQIPFTDIRLPELHPPKRGEVVVFLYPEDPKKAFIKRLVATGGETVEIKEGRVYVNNELLSDGIFGKNTYYNRGDYGQEGIKTRVPAWNYFFLGDNSNNSKDSRFWGFVPQKSILGKAMVIYWPPKRIRIIK